jgi:hypothetical protein
LDETGQHWTDAAPQRDACASGCDHPDCVSLLCWLHHRAYDTGRLELLLHLKPRRCREVAHAVLHLGLVGAYRRFGRARVA